MQNTNEIRKSLQLLNYLKKSTLSAKQSSSSIKSQELKQQNRCGSDCIFSLKKFVKKQTIQNQNSNSIKSNQISNISKYSDQKHQIKRQLIYGSEWKQNQKLDSNNNNNNKNILQSISTNGSFIKQKQQQEKQKIKLYLNDFIMIKKLGSGKFGQTFLSIHKKTGLICALKKISKKNIDINLLNQIIREIKIQLFLNHPNIVKLYTFFADKGYIILVMQLCFSGQLYNLIKKNKKITQLNTKWILLQICKAIDYMHQNQVIHRDLKPQNIIYHNGLVKICDFGWSISSKSMRQTFCGTPLYVSPELLTKKNYNNKIDIWSVGILTYQLLFGRVPFDIVCQQDLNKIAQDEIKFSKGTKISDQAKDFIMICLQKDPRDRYTMPQLLEHPFLIIPQGFSIIDLN